MKAEGPADDWQTVLRWDEGAAWIAHPEEGMQRASAALATDGGVWVVDPLDTPGLDDLLAGFGEVAGVAVLLDRHWRDAETVAARHDVPVAVPESFDVDERALGPGVDLERFRERLPGTDYRTIRVVDNALWTEVALFDGETLVVPEAVGTNEFVTGGRTRVGVHPVLRPVPPRGALGGLDPDRLLVGHGPGVEEGAASALEEALRRARRDTPWVVAGMVRGLVGG